MCENKVTYSIVLNLNSEFLPYTSPKKEMPLPDFSFLFRIYSKLNKSWKNEKQLIENVIFAIF